MSQNLGFDEARCSPLPFAGQAHNDGAAVPHGGTFHKVIREGNRNTYIIIVKENANTTSVQQQFTTFSNTPPNAAAESWDEMEDEGIGGSVSFTRPRRRPALSVKDDIRRNLTNITDDDEYDSGLSASSVFAENEVVVEVKTEQAEIPPKTLGPTKSDTLLKRNIFDSFSSPPAGSVPLTNNTITPQTRQSNMDNSGLVDPSKVSRAAFSTPSQSCNLAKHPTARKIFLVTPSPQQDSGPNLIKSVAFQHVLTPSSASSSQNNTSVCYTPSMDSSGYSSFNSSCGHLSTPGVCTPQTTDLISQIAKTQITTPKLEKQESLSDASLCSSQESLPSSSQESTDSSTCTSGTNDKDHGLDNSLTNIQWLRGIQLKSESKSTSSAPPVNPSRVVSRSQADPPISQQQSNQPLQWRYLTAADINKISKECGRAKRPPFSYMSLIQMALNSREDKKMTLKEICKWIEETFTYYKYTAKPGWRNSIRHNLSLYNIFEREPSKRHGSYWTIKEDCSPRSKTSRDQNKDKDQAFTAASSNGPAMIPIFPMFGTLPSSTMMSQMAQFANFPQAAVSGMSKKKGLLPILPRPSPLSSMQAFALIPLQGLQGSLPVMAGHTTPMIVQLPTGLQHVQPTSCTDEVAAAVASLEDSSGNYSNQSKNEKSGSRLVGIAPKGVAPNRLGSDILKEAWLQSSCTLEESLDTGAPKTGLSKDGHVPDNRQCEQKAKRQRVKPGLPKPKIYKECSVPKKVKMSKKKEKEKERDLFHDSSDEESEFIARLEKGFPTPIRELLDSQDTDNGSMATSTPYKEISISQSQLPSPIQGLTPLRTGNLFESSFLDCFKDTDICSNKGPLLSPDLQSRKKSSPGLGLDRTPNMSQWIDMNMLPNLTSPERGDGQQDDNGHSLSRFLSDFPIDEKAMLDDVEDYPVDVLPANLSNLNWSAVQQITNTMDVS